MMLIKLFLLVLIFQNFSCEESYYIKIGDKEFPFTLKDTAVANELKAKFPLEIDMTKLNDNEIYYRFDTSFTTNTKSVGTINIGDIYLYQSDCLVLFYKTFTTSYQYSEIGSLSSTDGLAEAIDSKSTVKVEWFTRNTNTPSNNDTKTDNTSSDTTKTDTPTNNTTPAKNSTSTNQTTDDDNFNRFNKTFNSSLFLNPSLLLFISLIFIFI
jgi:hypothetical protein